MEPSQSRIPCSVNAVVIGAGGAGLAALKNLVESGFISAIALDERPVPAGLWAFTEDPTKTSVLCTTVGNLSKQVSCYTDWPFAEEVPDYPSAEDINEYLNSYADHFELKERIKCGVVVNRVERNEDGTRWSVYWHFAGKGEEKLLEAEKVVIANGKWNVPFIPKLEGIEDFQGSVRHSQSFKNPADYKGKRVLVVGFSNTGGDLTTELVGVASKVYLSHKYGGFMVRRRNKKGRPLDHIRTRRGATFVNYVESLIPNALDALVNNPLAIYFIQRSTSGGMSYPSSWGLYPKIPISRGQGVVVNDYLFDNLRNGKVTILPAVARIHKQDNNGSPLSKGDTVEFVDGTIIEGIDAIIYATGYINSSYSSFLPNNDPTIQDSDIAEAWRQASSGREGVPLFRLFHNIFSLSHPTSLAFVGQVSAGASAFSMFDVQSMAIAQVFSGKYHLPPHDELCRLTRQQNLYTVMKRRTAPILPGLVPLKGLLEFLDEAAGCGLREHLSYVGRGSWRSWSWSLRNWRLSRALMSGVDTPFVWRLFDSGRRKKWEGAESAIWEANGLR
ncbi:flavin-binding monooxygenase-like-domain-containing protein [Lentinula aciculospora]|uniref:Flavin-binding monooxygenase-like-domain-containing protein n=1 Tax=Lentinula aciculospora TaxID=153920 RepID=A0A9W9DMC7_9AGAR|nr:flavin-binding monooxygenase-like-domain-containing protein [Lentinula aciculospora]